jgi:Flp pilus assembly pilin Flp
LLGGRFQTETLEEQAMRLLVKFVRDEKGEDLIEYGLLAAFVAGIALLVLTSPNLKTAISVAFEKAISALGAVSA